MKDIVVFGVIGDDIHVVANRIMAIGLRNAGFNAINLGTHNSPQDFVDAVLETEAKAVLVSSINGEGEHWCANFRKRFEDIGFDKIVLYAGGNLVVGSRDPKEVSKLFIGYGFDRVFYGQVSFDDVFSLLKTDIQEKAGL